MFENHLKIAWRNLLKRKFYTLITILGLSVGMTFAFLMMSYIRGELNVNQNLKNPDRHFLVQSKWKQPDMGLDITTLAPLGKTLKEQYPNLVANYYRYDGITVAVSKADKHFREDVQTGDSTLISMYGFPLLYGEALSALSKPNSVVITENKALKYFGTANVVGQSLTLHNFLGGKQEFQVTAVLKNLSNNSISHLLASQAEIFIPFNSLEGRKGPDNNWNFPIMVTYVELQKGVTPADLEKPVKQILNTNAPEYIKPNLQVYFTSLQDYYFEANGGVVRKMIMTISCVTAFILLMAVVNFVNISIGKSSSRLKEIGVRKVLGSLKRQLIGQFLAESILLALFSMAFSIVFYKVFRHYFSDILGKPLDSAIELFPYSFFIPICCAVLVGLLGGVYPAFVLSSIPSVDSMKGKVKSIRENIYFRRLLVGFQFSVAIFVFAGAVIISSQVSYFFNKNLGYQKESVITVGVPRDWTAEGLAKMGSVRNAMSQLKEVSEVSLSYEIPNGNGGANGIYKIGQDSLQAIQAQFLGTDEHYADTYRMKLIAGRFFQDKNGTYQPDRIVLNEAAVKALGYRTAIEAVGQQVRVYNFPNPLRIEGVTQNFHFESMHKAIKPLAFIHINGGNAYRFLSFRMAPGAIGESVAAVEKKWRELMPDAPFEYVFLDDTIRKLYLAETQLSDAARIATFLAIIIVVLGVLGMVSLNVSRRTRELGIRKVLGASSVSIITIFLYEFLYVLLFSTVFTVPFVCLVMNRWLNSYAYHIGLDWKIFISTGVAFAFLIVILVCIQTYKAATMNPVKSIKTE